MGLASLANYIGSAVLGLGMLVALGFIWAWLSTFWLGRVIQVLVASVTYFAWMGLPLFGLYSMANGVAEGLSNGNAGGAIFVALYGSAAMLVMLAIPTAGFNYYLKMLNEKLGTKFRYVSWLADPR